MAGNPSALSRSSASFDYLSHSAALSFGPSCACPVFNSTNFVMTFVANRGSVVTLPEVGANKLHGAHHDHELTGIVSTPRRLADGFERRSWLDMATTYS